MDHNKKNRWERLDPITAPAEKKGKDKEVSPEIETYTYPDGSKYVGEYKDSKRHGTGTSFIYPGGAKYEGEWKDGEKHGRGVYTYPDGSKYVGEYKDGMRYGTGTYIYPDGRTITGYLSGRNELYL